MESPTRPLLEDEHDRRAYWERNLGEHGDRENVIRNAAQALAIRDGEIARLMSILRDCRER